MSLYEDWMKKAFSQEGRSIEAVLGGISAQGTENL